MAVTQRLPSETICPGTWIYRVAQNTALPVVHRGGGQQDIRRYVDRLPEDLRDVVILCYYQERSVDDVAAMLELPAGTVKSHLSRARRMLAEQMKGARPQ